MPLPDENKPWPPPAWVAAFEQYVSNNAWYTGDVETIQALAQINGGQFRGDDANSHYNFRQPRRPGFGLLRSIFGTFSFWGQQNHAGDARTRLHAPLASNLPSLSGDLLMGEPPTSRIMLKGQTVKGPAQDRADDILNSPEMFMRLQQGAEYAAALSASVLTANWNPDVTDEPCLEVTACDAAIPEYTLGMLSAMNLWTTYPEVNGVGVMIAVYYHVERHEIGRIVHALYKGTESSIGERVPLQSHPATENIPLIPGSVAGVESNTVYLPSGVKSITARFWRNLPTRQFRRDGTLSRIGRADIEGVEGMLDSVDMTWSSWMRDIKLARARLIVPESMLDVRRAGGGGNFDDDAEIVQALNFVNLKGEDDHIRAEQFGIRHAEHSATLLALTKEVLQHAGYSQSSYGQQGETSAATATETNDRRTTSEATRDKKALYFRSDAGESIFSTLLELDAVHYRRRGSVSYDPDWDIDIVFPDVSQIDPEKQARVLSGWRVAMAASTETLVRALHPDWEDDQVGPEVEKINRENGISDDAPDPTIIGRFPPPAPGDPNAPDPNAPDQNTPAGIPDPNSTDPNSVTPGKTPKPAAA